MQALDSHSRVSEIRAQIQLKPSLKRLYQEIYEKYVECLNRCPKSGFALELGSGAGFAKQMVPKLITSDILSYQGVDQVVDATELPFEDQSISFIGMVNVFHHIPDTERFLQEAQRCLLSGQNTGCPVHRNRDVLPIRYPRLRFSLNVVSVWMFDWRRF